MNSREEREKLKEVYKEHYRALKDLKEKAVNAKRVASVKEALQNISDRSVVDRLDQAVETVQLHIAKAEAKLEYFMDAHSQRVQQEESEAWMDKEQARQTIQQIRAEMGLVHKDIEDKLSDLPEVSKSIGPEKRNQPSDKSSQSTSPKTIGPRN